MAELGDGPQQGNATTNTGANGSTSSNRPQSVAAQHNLFQGSSSSSSGTSSNAGPPQHGSLPQLLQHSQLSSHALSRHIRPQAPPQQGYGGQQQQQHTQHHQQQQQQQQQQPPQKTP